MRSAEVQNLTCKEPAGLFHRVVGRAAVSNEYRKITEVIDWSFSGGCEDGLLGLPKYLPRRTDAPVDLRHQLGVVSWLVFAVGAGTSEPYQAPPHRFP